ncbi:MAG: hypothetical protein IJX51_05270 [Clostridia bacterium]|nr:hypothetical protein [Clostridia bacterium]
MNEATNAIGFLIVEAVTANGALPVADAMVHIFEYGEDDPDISDDAIYSLRTDRSGRTDKLALEAKDKELSLSPDNTKPFSSYSIIVNADGYYESEKINIPIFQGITSIQAVNLIPLSEFSDPYSPTPDTLGRFTRVSDSNN